MYANLSIQLFTGIFPKEHNYHLEVMTYRAKIYVLLHDFDKATKVFETVVKKFDKDDFRYHIFCYIIGSIYVQDEKFDEAQKWLMKLIEVDSFWFYNDRLDVDPEDSKLPYIFDYKTRCLYQLGLIKYGKKEWEAAEMALIEFNLNVSEPLLKWLFNKKDMYPLDLMGPLIEDTTSLQANAKRILSEIMEFEQNSSPKVSKEFSDLIKRYQADRKLQECMEEKDYISNQELVDCFKEIVQLHKGTCYEDDKSERMFRTTIATTLKSMKKYEEAVMMFDTLLDHLLDGGVEVYRNPEPLKSESQILAKQESWYMTWFDYINSLDECSMEDESCYVTKCLAERFDLTSPQNFKLDFHADFLEPVMENCTKTGDVINAKKYCNALQNLVQKNKKYFKDLSQTEKKYEPESLLVALLNKKALLEFMQVRYSNDSKKKYEITLKMIPLRYQRGNILHVIATNFMHRTLCLFKLGRYREAVKVMEQGSVEVPKYTKPKARLFFDSVYPVLRSLLALKIGERNKDKLINKLKAPEEFEKTLKAFENFDSPPSLVVYEYLNLQSKHWKTRQESKNKLDLRKWRMFKNSAIIICHSRCIFRMENIIQT